MSSRISTQGSRTSSPPRQSFEVNSRRSSVKLDNVDLLQISLNLGLLPMSHLQPLQHSLK